MALENRLSNRSRAGSLAPRSFSRASSMAPVQSTSSYHASSLAPRSLRASSMAPRHEPVVRMVDTSMPLHRFGSRLAVTKADINIKPAIYGEFETCPPLFYHLKMGTKCCKLMKFLMPKSSTKYTYDRETKCIL